jgi:hypothetical protein
MTPFQLCGLPAEPFAAWFELPDADLAARGARRVRADSDFGYPCRIGLEDAAVGDELLLLSYLHQPALSPYRASGPIYVRRHARQRRLAPGEVPPVVTRRLISLRAYDTRHLMVEGQVVEGDGVAARLAALFDRDDVAYVHLHNARRGCYSCLAQRLGRDDDPV